MFFQVIPSSICSSLVGISLHPTSNISRSCETVIMPIGSVIIVLLIVLNIALVIEIIRIRRRTSW